MRITLGIAIGCLLASIVLAPRLASAQGTMSQSAEMPVHIEKSAAEVIGNNFHLIEKLNPLLPADFPPAKAAVGYYDIEQFVLAVHAAHDIHVPFSQFRCTELGGRFCDPPTTAKGMSLEKTIQLFRPSMKKNAIKAAVKQAKKESREDLKGVNLY